MAKSSNKSTSDPSCLTLSVKSQDQDVLFFKIRSDTPLKKLLLGYCSRKVVDYKTATFLINGERFDHHANANQLGLKDGHEIDIMMPVDGGGYGIV